MAAVYEEKCAEFSVPPRPEIARIFENALPTEPFAIALPGNSLELFDGRLSDVDVIAMVQTILHGGYRNLESLDLSFHTLTDAAATAIALLLSDAGDYSCALRTLNLRGNDIGQKGCRKLCAALKRNTTVQFLSLNGNPVGNEGGMSVAAMLAKNTALLTLDLGNSEQGTESIIAMAAVLKQNATLSELNLENPRLFSLGEESTYQLAKMLQVNTTLCRLNLAKHKVRDDGARMLAQNLSQNSTLEELDLRCNEVGIAGGEALAALLMQPGCALRTMNLASNRVNDDGALALGAALRRNKALAALDLSKNGICDDGLVAIATGMETNDSLVDLRLWGNDFGQPSATMFHSLADRRFKYLDVRTDIRTNVVDGVVHVAQC
jgi:Ran GTPase-activating protein (RanGAP) involved in mRNA processing and transport